MCFGFCGSKAAKETGLQQQLHFAATKLLPVLRRELQNWTPLTQVRFPGAAEDFFLRVKFQCRFSHVCPYTPCAIACNNICAHVKDPLVHVRVRWIVETLKHPVCTVGWVARLCRSCLLYTSPSPRDRGISRMPSSA